MTVTGDTTANTITSTVATGTAPFVVTSTTPVVNLNIGGNAATASVAQSGSTLETYLTDISGGLSTEISRAQTAEALKANLSGATFTGDITNSSTTESTSNTTGSITTSGGLGVTKNVNIGGDMTVIGDTTTNTITSTVATGTAPFVVTSTTPVVNLSIGGNAATASVAQSGSTLETYLTDISGNLETEVSRAQTAEALKANLSGATFTGDITNSSTTESNSNTTGSITTSGGLGVTKNVNIGGDTSIVGTASLGALNVTNSTTLDAGFLLEM